MIIAKILKKLLSAVTLSVMYRDGDLLTIRLTYGGNVIFDRTIDVMKQV